MIDLPAPISLPGNRRIMTADAHDVAASVMARRQLDGGEALRRHKFDAGMLTPEGNVLLEGRMYEMEWREQRAGGQLRGHWEIVSEALDE